MLTRVCVHACGLSQELERRLASVIQQGFEDSPTLWGQFKLLDSFHGLLSRPIVAVREIDGCLFPYSLVE